MFWKERYLGNKYKNFFASERQAPFADHDFLRRRDNAVRIVQLPHGNPASRKKMTRIDAELTGRGREHRHVIDGAQNAQCAFRFYAEFLAHKFIISVRGQ